MTEQREPAAIHGAFPAFLRVDESHVGPKRRIVALWIPFVLFVFATSRLWSAELSGSLPSYKDAPAFYEFAWEYFGPKENLELMHERRANVGVMGIVETDSFDWFATARVSARKGHPDHIRCDRRAGPR